MSLILNDLFDSLRDFQDMVPAVESSTTFAELNSSAASAKKQISNIITAAIYKSTSEITDNTAELKAALQSAMANATMARQLVFDVMKLRKAGNDIFKNEREAMSRSYTENYYNSMDTLLTLLDSVDAWKETDYYKKKESLKIQSAEEFNAFYPIDGSYLFFFRCISIQEEILDDILTNYFEKVTEDVDNKDLITKRLMRALAQLTVASAIRRFDPQELPSTIRNLHEDSTASRSAETEQSKLLDLSTQLAKSAMEILTNVDNILISSTDATDIETETSFNEITDKLYLSL